MSTNAAQQRYCRIARWVLPFVAALATAVDAETLSVGGTGSSAPLVKLLFDEFRKAVPEAALKQASPPLGSGGALKALASGRIDLALIGRPLKDEERPMVGESFVLAATPFVLASNGGLKKNGFTPDELVAVYAGTVTKWDDGSSIRLILRASFESDTLTLKALSPTMAT